MRYLTGKRIVVAVLLVLALYWAGKTVFKQIDSRHFLSKSVPFQNEVIQLDSPESDGYLDNGEVLLEHETYLQNYIDEAFELLSDYKFDPADTAEIADRVYSGLSNLSMWLNNQHFSHQISGSEIPPSYKKEEIEAKIASFLDDVISRNKDLQNPIVARTHHDWAFLYDRQNNQEFKEVEQFRADLLKLLYHYIVYPLDPNIRRKDLAERISLGIAAYELSSDLFGVYHETGRQELWIMLNDHLDSALAGKRVRFGFWQEPGRVEWSQKLGTYRKKRIVMRRIGGDLADKYLTADLGNALAKVGTNIMLGKLNQKTESSPESGDQRDAKPTREIPLEGDRKCIEEDVKLVVSVENITGKTLTIYAELLEPGLDYSSLGVEVRNPREEKSVWADDELEFEVYGNEETCWDDFRVRLTVAYDSHPEYRHMLIVEKFSKDHISYSTSHLGTLKITSDNEVQRRVETPLNVTFGSFLTQTYGLPLLKVKAEEVFERFK